VVYRVKDYLAKIAPCNVCGKNKSIVLKGIEYEMKSEKAMWISI